MEKSKLLTVVERARITTLYEKNYSLCLIAHRLKIPMSTVHDTIDHYNDHRRTSRKTFRMINEQKKWKTGSTEN